MSTFRNEVSRDDMAVIDQARIDVFFTNKHNLKEKEKEKEKEGSDGITSIPILQSNGAKRAVDEQHNSHSQAKKKK